MLVPPIPLNETKRLNDLIETELLDTPHENEFDDIVKLASEICKTPISLITLVDTHRAWSKAEIGMKDAHGPRELSFCGHAILDDKLFEVQDTLNDDRFYDNPFVLGEPNIRFYAGFPLTTTSGSRIGSLCVVDTVPRELTESQRLALEVLSRNVIKIAELRIKNRELNRMAETQKKMTSILAHDVRSPLVAISSIMEYKHSGIISEEESEDMMGLAIEQLNNTVQMVNDVVDWGESQLKFYNVSRENVGLKDLVDNIFGYEALKARLKNNDLVNQIKSTELSTDKHALSFIIRNLVNNANKYTENGNISVSATKKNGFIYINIKDTGSGMDSEMSSKLFGAETISRRGTSNEKGNGLGLMLINEYINKLSGTISVESEPGKGSCFTIRLSEN